MRSGHGTHRRRHHGSIGFAAFPAGFDLKGVSPCQGVGLALCGSIPCLPAPEAVPRLLAGFGWSGIAT